jgi:dihydroorotate dehydrogenase
MNALDRLALAGLSLLAPERAHRVTALALRSRLLPARPALADPILKSRVFGLDFPNPVGLAAGFDKDATLFAPMLRQGFGFVEIGSVTRLPQPGNPRPRLFRLTEDEALINRMGFNNAGLAAACARLGRRDRAAGFVGANIGRNKESADALADYRAGLLALAPVADYLVVNVSSPNTPGLRALQGRAALDALLTGLFAARAEVAGSKPIPLLVKLAPDLSTAERREVAELALAHGVDGLVLGNSTLARPPSLRSAHRGETGGLSGRPLFSLALALVAEMYDLTNGRIPLVGVGGIASGEDAYRMIRSGASLVQLYTALVYQGPGLVQRIQAELARALRRDGFADLAQAVGIVQRTGEGRKKEQRAAEPLK